MNRLNGLNYLNQNVSSLQGLSALTTPSLQWDIVVAGAIPYETKGGIGGRSTVTAEQSHG